MSNNAKSRLVVVRNEKGIHLRPADQLVRRAQQYESDIKIVKDGETFDGKSILSVISLVAEQGTELVLRATGPDADDALDALVELFERGFDEMSAAETTEDSSADR